jgi:hypothetical protein
MFPNNLLFGGLAKVILTLVIIGVLVGLALAGTDLVNFITNNAKAQAIKNQNDFQAQKDAIDLKNYGIVQEALTQNQIDQANADNAAHNISLEQDLQFQIQKAAQALEMDRYLNYAGIGSVIFLAFCSGIGTFVLLFFVGRSRLVLAQAQTRQADRWQDSGWLKHQIKRSRQYERMQRKSLYGSSTPYVSPFYPSEEPIPWDGFPEQYVEVQRP